MNLSSRTNLVDRDAPNLDSRLSGSDDVPHKLVNSRSRYRQPTYSLSRTQCTGLREGVEYASTGRDELQQTGYRNTARRLQSVFDRIHRDLRDTA